MAAEGPLGRAERLGSVVFASLRAVIGAPWEEGPAPAWRASLGEVLACPGASLQAGLFSRNTRPAPHNAHSDQEVFLVLGLFQADDYADTVLVTWTCGGGHRGHWYPL